MNSKQKAALIDLLKEGNTVLGVHSQSSFSDRDFDYTGVVETLLDTIDAFIEDENAREVRNLFLEIIETGDRISDLEDCEEEEIESMAASDQLTAKVEKLKEQIEKA